ncbi:MAG TPA: hypothetical protein VFQ68_43100 [Streptosporangiaceae bacterium]|nr:hypothetical protein [Streptosporangiaceae bacterium]
MQRGRGIEVLAQQDGERADHAGRPPEPLGDPLDLLQDVTGAVGVGVVVGVAGGKLPVSVLLSLKGS